MKKFTVVFTVLLIGLTSVAATVETTTNDGKKLGISKRYHFTQPILFVERGVEFLIFPNGEFDFNTELVSTQNNANYYYRRTPSRRSSVNVTFGSPGRNEFYNSPRGTLVQHDRNGRVRRIGNVFLNYDAYGRIKRIGSVYMRYRNNRLVQVGGLKIRYNRHGEIVKTQGQVNYHNHGYNYFTQNNTYSSFNDDSFTSNEDYYYYKKGNTIKKREKILRK